MRRARNNPATSPGASPQEGFDVETAILYRAEPRLRLAQVAETALKERTVDGVLLYSRRSAAAFALALRAAGLAPLPPDVTCFCISDSTAEAVSRVTTGRVRIAAKPDQLALFATIEAEEISGAARETHAVEASVPFAGRDLRIVRTYDGTRAGN